MNYVIIGPKTSVNYAAKVLHLFDIKEFILKTLNFPGFYTIIYLCLSAGEHGCKITKT